MKLGYLVLLVFALGCQDSQLSWKSGGQTTLGGKLFSSSSSSSLIAALGTDSCTDPEAVLYKLTDEGDKLRPAISRVPLASDGSYIFQLRGTGVTFKQEVPSVPLIVVIEGCSKQYSRPVTGNRDQHMSVATTVFSYGLNTASKERLSLALRNNLKAVDQIFGKLMTVTANDDVADAINGLPQLSTVLGLDLALLSDAAPNITTHVVPTSAPEASSVTFRAVGEHWLQSYPLAYEWRLNGATVSRNATYAWTPGRNAQGTYGVTLLLGRNDGTGEIDFGKPHKILTTALVVQNTFPPTPPVLSVTAPAGPGPSAQRNLTLALATGAGLVNCASLTDLAITETGAIPPSSAFTISCYVDGSQAQAYSLTSAGDGLKVLRLWARDSSGTVSSTPVTVQVTLDTTAPVVSISSITSLSTSTSQTITFSGSDASDLSYQCKLDAGAYSSCSSPKTYTGLAEGNHTVSVMATDAAGNVSSVVTASWSIDSTLPTLALTTTPSAVTNVLAGNFVFSGTDSNGLTYLCQLDGGAAFVCTSPYAPALSPGSHTFSVQALDTAGNLSAAQSYSWIIDVTPPTASISSGPASVTQSTSATFVLAATDAGGGSVSGFQCQIDGAAFGSCSSPVTYTGLTQGTHLFSVRAIDSAGNVSPSVSFSWVLDLTAPSITLVSTPNAVTNQTSASISFSGTDSGGGSVASFNCRLDGAAFSSCSSPVSFTALSEGSHTVQIQALDSVGNIGTQSFTWQVDLTAPPTSGFALNPGSSGNTTTPNILGSTEGGSTVTIHLNSATCASASVASGTATGGGAFSLTTSALSADGAYAYYVKVIDPAGNQSCSSSLAYVLDRVPPSITLSALTGGQLIRGSQNSNITWSASDAVALETNPIRLEYSLTSGGSWTAIVAATSNNGTYSWSVPGFNSSTARVRAIVTDLAGNTATSASVSNFTIDSSVPLLTLTSLTGGEVLRGGVAYALNWTATDANASGNWIALSYSSDGGGTWTAITTLTNTGTHSWTVPLINSSAVRVRIIATDSVGQSTTVQSTSNLIIDSTAPALTLTSLTGGQAFVGNSPQNITWSASDTNLGGSPVSIDLSSNSGSTWSGIASNIANSGSFSWGVAVADGNNYRIRVRVTDLAGNSTIAASSSDFVVASSAPNLTQTGSVTPFYSNSATSVSYGGSCSAGFNVTVSGAESATVACPAGTWTWSTATISGDDDRTYTFTQFNGVLTTTRTARWIRDTTTPSVTAVVINSGDALTPVPTVSVSVTTSEANVYIRLANAASTGASCQAEYSNTNWNLHSSTTVSYNHVLSSGDGAKKICAWVGDLAGNISVITPSAGSAGVDMDTISFGSGNPPQIASFDVANDQAGPFYGTTRTNVNDPLRITWSVSDVEGLSNTPIFLDYTTNGSTWIPIEAGYGSNLSSNPTTYSDTYLGFSAPVNTFFRVRIRVRDMAGNTSSELISKSFNTTPWSVFAGSRGRGIGGSAKSVWAMRPQQQWPFFHSNPTNSDIYYMDGGNGLVRVSAATGIATLVIPQGTNNIPVGSGTITASHRVHTYFDKVIFDRNGFMYLFIAPGGITTLTNTSRVLRINPATWQYTTYLAGGLLNDATATASNVFVLQTGAQSFDESNTLYFLTSCTPGTNYIRNGGSTVRMMKVTQNSDGTAGTVSVVAGNCVRATPTSGSVAATSPMTNATDNPWSISIAAWDNGNVIYYSSGGGVIVKIINGLSYPVSAFTMGDGTLNWSSIDQRLYVISDSVRAFIPNLSGANGETEDTSKRILGTATGATCFNDGVPAASACGSYVGGFLNSTGRVFFTQQVGLYNQLRYLDDTGNIQTLIGTPAFTGDGMRPTLAKGNFGGIYYKKASEPLATTFPEGLYFLENQGGVFGYFTPTTTVRIWGNQSGKNTPAGGATVSPLTSMGPQNMTWAGAGTCMSFDPTGRPWFKYNFNIPINLSSTLTIESRVTTTTWTWWEQATVGADPRNSRWDRYGCFQNITIKGSAKAFLMGIHFEPAFGFTDTRPVLRMFDYENNVIRHIMGGTGTTSTPDQTTPGSLETASLDGACINQLCNLNYVTSQDRLYFSENTKLRYITDPENPSQHTLRTVFTTTGAWIEGFTVSPNNKYIVYTMGSRLYCHAINVVDESAICKNNPASHINLGPPTGLTTISRGPNQFTWKDDLTLYVSTYQGEIYEYVLYH